jgi:hypothetical protein
MARLLIKAGAKYQDNVDQEHKKIARLLIKAGAKWNIRNNVS